jgi:DNA-binding transcriptional regulator YdaS (Cro superfamily)
MKLETYLRRVRKISPERFGAEIGVSGQAVRMWIDGARMPRRPLLIAIEEATGGKVKANDFIPKKTEADSGQAHAHAVG